MPAGLQWHTAPDPGPRLAPRLLTNKAAASPPVTPHVRLPASALCAQPRPASDDLLQLVLIPPAGTLTRRTAQATKRLSLLTIGEIGRTADLSGFPHLRTALTEALGSSSEDIKSAASTALGAVCIGNLGAYMPFLLQQIQALVGLLACALC